MVIIIVLFVSVSQIITIVWRPSCILNKFTQPASKSSLYYSPKLTLSISRPCESVHQVIDYLIEYHSSQDH